MKAPALSSLAALLASASARAAGVPSAPQLFSGAYLAQVLGSLLLVFLCLFAVIYLLRRFNRIGSVQGMPLRVLGSASVGTREKIVLIEAGSEQLLIGVAQGSVRTLHVLPEPIVHGDAAAANPDFAQILRAANPLGGRA
jgi:flagellar protein FliO/FliZ